MYVDVSERDIKRGIPKNMVKCPIAIALRRATGIRRLAVGTDGEHGEVEYGIVTFARSGALPKYGLSDEEVFVFDKDFNFRLPKKTNEFMQLFDNGEPVKPFRFYIAIEKFLDRFKNGTKNKKR